VSKYTLLTPGDGSKVSLSTTTPTPATTFTMPWAATTRGNPTLLAPLSPTSFMVAGEDGWSGHFSVPTGKFTQGKDQSPACVASAVWVDVPSKASSSKTGGGVGGSSSGGGGGGGGGATTLTGLDLPSRLQAQASFLLGGLESTLGSLTLGFSDFSKDPVGAVLRFVGARRRKAVPGRLTTVEATLSGGLSKAFITLALTDPQARTLPSSAAPEANPCVGGWLPSIAPKVRGVLSAVDVSGKRSSVWRVPLPLAPGLAVGGGGGGGEDYRVTLLPSRPAPLSPTQPAEVLLIESMPEVGGAGKGVRVVATYVNAGTGEVTGSTTFSAPSHPTSASMLPFTSEPESRLAYLVSGEGQGQGEDGEVAIPATITSPSSATTLASLGSSHVHVKVTPNGEGLSGHVYRHGSSSSVVGGGGGGGGGGDTTNGGGSLQPVWTSLVAPCASRDPQAPHILALSTPSNPTPVAFGDSPHYPPRAKTLPGDDSLLIKYQNPNFIAVVVGKSGVVSTPLEKRLYGGSSSIGGGVTAPSSNSSSSSGSGGEGGGCGRESSAPTPTPTPTLTLTLLDTMSGRVLHSRRHAGATGPVHLTLHDNWVVYSYWSLESGRSELGVATLWERAAVNTYDLTPWAKSTPATSAYLSLDPVSSYAMATPYVKHAVYVPSESVTGLSILSTRGGVSPPALLMHTAREGVQVMELKWVDPRRPLPPGVGLDGKPLPPLPPSPEGLFPYSPYLPHHHALFLNHGVPLHRTRLMLTSHTEWESSGVVAVVGVDQFFARVATAKKFDQLDPDFNKGIFVGAMLTFTIVNSLLAYFSERKALAERELTCVPIPPHPPLLLPLSQSLFFPPTHTQTHTIIT
jgi:hypothetical protein